MTAMVDDNQDAGSEALPEVDYRRPSPARIYDFWLGGSHNFAADREIGQRVLDAMPMIRPTAWANRAFLRRLVHHLVTDCGVSQFLDLGSGVPTAGNVHEIAQALDPRCRIVYVDIDPVAVAHSRHILVDNAGARVVHGDLRRPEEVIGSQPVRDILDFDRPVAVLLISVLHFIADHDDPAGIVRRYTRDLAPGSYLGLSHGIPAPNNQGGQSSAADDYFRVTRTPVVVRDTDTITSWCAGMTFEPPGLVPVNQWRPDGDTPDEPVAQVGLLARIPNTQRPEPTG